MLTISEVIYFVLVFLKLLNDPGRNIDPTGSILFTLKL
jgi:hypothetical protein